MSSLWGDAGGGSVRQAYKRNRRPSGTRLVPVSDVMVRRRPNYRRRTIYRGLVGNRTHTFRVNAQPFHIGFTPGTTGNFGCSFYQDNTVPISGGLIGTGNNNFSLTYTLAGVVVWFGPGPGSATVPMASVSEYTALFDSYRITGVEVTMYSSMNMNQSVTQFLPNLGVVTDYDDGTPITWAEAAQYENFKVIQFSVPNKKVLRCKPLASSTVANTGGVFVPANAFRSQWMDCASNNINYYGNKFCFDNPMQGAATAAANEGFVTFHVRYTVEFKGTR